MTLLLPPWLGASFNLPRVLADDGRWSGSEAYRLLERFDLASHERVFVKTILERRTNLWVFRAHQRHACGDFIIVDMSSPRAVTRQSYVLELKSGEPLVIGGARLQCARYREALAEIAAHTGIIEALTPNEVLYGDAAVVLDHLGR